MTIDSAVTDERREPLVRGPNPSAPPADIASPASLKDSLRRKSRTRRRSLARQAEVDLPLRQPRNDLVPRLELVQRLVSRLHSPVRNVRPADPAHVREIANSIAALGFCRPVLIDQDDRVIDGMASLEAARQCGLASIYCVMAGHLTAAERRTLRVALNRIGEKGRWDLDELRLEFQELILETEPLEITGFSSIELDQILSDGEPDGTQAGPLEPEPALPPVARPGDIFLAGSHRVACGDARDPELLLRLLEGRAVRLVLTDQPYNVPIAGHVSRSGHREFALGSGEMTDDQFAAFNAAWISAAIPHLVDGGLLATFIDWRGLLSVTAAARGADLEQINFVVWAKSNGAMGSLYRSQHELLPIFKKGSAPHINNVQLGQHGRWRSNVWSYPGASSAGTDARKGLKLHPTVKPVAMLEDALLDVTRRGDIVLDPFLGSGSTLIAAEKTGRVCRAVELDPLYVDVAIRRFQAVTGRRAVLERTGEAFDELINS